MPRATSSIVVLVLFSGRCRSLTDKRGWTGDAQIAVRSWWLVELLLLLLGGWIEFPRLLGSSTAQRILGVYASVVIAIVRARLVLCCRWLLHISKPGHVRQ